MSRTEMELVELKKYVEATDSIFKRYNLPWKVARAIVRLYAFGGCLELEG
jgi:hypothetical protein